MQEPQTTTRPGRIQDSDRVRTVRQLYNEARNCPKRQAAEKLWKQAQCLYDGDHWSTDLGGPSSYPTWRAKLVVNKINPRLRKALSLLVSQSAEIEILPREQDDVEPAESLDAYISYLWQTQGWTTTFAEIYLKTLQRRVAWLKVYWDQHAENGRGLPCLEPVSTWDLYIHPNSVIRGGELKSLCVIHKMMMTKEAIIARYNVDVTEAKREEPQSTFSPLGAPVAGNKESAAQQELRGGGVTVAQEYEVLEAWLVDETRVETPETDDPDQPVEALMYPFGRVIVLANDRVVRDAGAHELGYDFLPFVPFTEDPDSERVYGPSVTNLAASPQMELNKRRSQLADYAGLCANPKGWVNPASGIDVDQLEDGLYAVGWDNEPGQFAVDITGGNGWAWSTPPVMPNEVIASAQLAEHDIDDIMNIFEVSRGELPSGVRSGVAIEALQSEAHGVMNLRSTFYQDSLRVVVRNLVSLIVRLVGDERVMRVKSPHPQGGYDFVPVNIPALFEGRDPSDIEFDIKVTAGTRALSKRLMSELALLLHREPVNQGQYILSDSALLDMLDVPNRDKILQDLTDMQQEQRVMAMVSAGVPVPPVMLATMALKKIGLPDEYMEDIAQVLEKAGSEVGAAMDIPTGQQEQQQPQQQPQQEQSQQEQTPAAEPGE